MKSRDQEILSRKYAVAFVHCYRPALNADFLEKSDQLYTQLYDHRFVLASFDLMLSSKAQKEAIADLITSWLSVDYIKPLIVLLVQKHRLFLLPSIIKKIKEEFLTEKKEVELQVESSSNLSVEQSAIITEFIMHKTGLKPRISYRINKKLIAGIRIASDTFLWERSIQRRLRELEIVLAQ